jgi:cell division protein FtsI (penicillin-binding protein 3)
MARVVRRKKSRLNRRFYGLIFFVILLAAAGVKLYRFPPSLLDINRIFRLAADKILDQSADMRSAESVLRGRIYDRDYREMAVSYLLYSLYVRPGEITDPEGVIKTVAQATGKPAGEIEARLKMHGNVIKIADHLEEAEIADIVDGKIKGVYVKPHEGRFYPEHETAAGLVGYAGDGIGLAGVEGAYDLVLKKGGFRSESLPEINFHGEQVLGRSTVDVVLTVDLALEKEIEKQLRAYLEKSGAARGVAILMDAKTGDILSWAEQPSFNPNYYWQVPEVEGNGLFQEALDSDLYREVKVRAAAIRKDGELAGPLLPVTVAAPDFGLDEQDIEQFGDLASLIDGEGQGLFFAGKTKPPADTGEHVPRTSGSIDVLQLTGAIAALMNGGWQVRPHVLASVYDHDLQRHFFRSADFDVQGRRRIVSPPMGIQLRRDLFLKNAQETDDRSIHAAFSVRADARGAHSEFIIRNLLVGVVPAKSPKLVLAVLTQQDDLFPAAGDFHDGTAELAQFGRNILPLLFGESEKLASVPFPKEPNSSNYTQFLISRRVDYQDMETRTAAVDSVMPELTGLSLRKGLQRLNGYRLSMTIEGSGRIIGQKPAAGSPMEGVQECILTLEPEI